MRKNKVVLKEKKERENQKARDALLAYLRSLARDERRNRDERTARCVH
ncbi:hypothetical protein [Atrimonas thermophila]